MGTRWYGGYLLIPRTHKRNNTFCAPSRHHREETSILVLPGARIISRALRRYRYDRVLVAVSRQTAVRIHRGGTHQSALLQAENLRVKRSCCCCGTSTCSQENTSGRKKASRCDARRSASVHRRRALPWIINRRTVPSPPLHVRKSAPEGVKGEQVRPSHHRPSPPPCRLFWPSQVGQNAALVADGAPLYRKSRPDSSISIDRKAASY
ncbi:hypothetical protein QE152_g13567 [Popillia japonica]|uniref:Uncharacterized protein n=1 Tax=Popillia japonica TaxID=7064 RepID=A0AAW1LAL7_POPJA